MYSFNYNIHLEAKEAEKLFYLLDNVKCINSNPISCDLCYHFSACKVITDVRNNLERYLEQIEEPKSIDEREEE